MVLINIYVFKEVTVNARTVKASVEFPLIALAGAGLLGLMFLFVLS
ncbi:MAG: hypothetical protein ACJAZ4_000974 [Neptuniibacter pectenicola]|jgi:hypothetical protein